MIIYLYGQPASGKTTLAKLLSKKLSRLGLTFNIDGDKLRDYTSNDDYSELGRRKNMENANLISTYLEKSKQSDFTILSVVSPLADIRDELNKNVNVIFFSLSTTQIRGRENYFTNIEQGNHFRYEIDTDKSIEECLEFIYSVIVKNLNNE